MHTDKNNRKQKTVVHKDIIFIFFCQFLNVTSNLICKLNKAIYFSMAYSDILHHLNWEKKSCAVLCRFRMKYF